MRARDALKCRERLAVESHIRANKKTGLPLEFSVEDIMKSSTYRLNRRGVAKALQNMAYQKAGIKKAGPSTYIAYTDSHVSWADDAGTVMPHAATSTVKLKGKRVVRRKPKRMAARAASVAERKPKSDKVPAWTKERHIVMAAAHLLAAGENECAERLITSWSKKQ